MAQVAADTVVPYSGKILVLRRNKYPFKGKLVLPGGHLEDNEKIREAAVREVREETNLDIEIDYLLDVYSDPNRDPRGRYISTAFVAKEKKDIENLKVNKESKKAIWRDPDTLKQEEMGFDHWQMIQDYLKKEENK